MASIHFEVGDLVKIIKNEWAGKVGIVSKPIAEQTAGHILVHKDGSILGRDTLIDEVAAADEISEGFAQLG